MKIMFILIVMLISACSSAESGPVIEVRDAWVRASNMMITENQDDTGAEANSHEGSMGGMEVNTAAYMVLVNSGDQVDKLLKVAGEAAQVIEIHESTIKDDVMSMRAVEFVEVPAKGQVALKPGGKHLMLVGLNDDLKPGDTVKLQLEFEISGQIQVEAEVRMP